MRRIVIVFLLIAGLAALAAGVQLAGSHGPAEPAMAAPAADGAGLVVVELFQSQGCSSCPPANANLIAIADRPDVLAVSFQVTYWDDLGWKDTFATPAYTQRQYDYAQGLGHSQVATPQMVVDGAFDLVGSSPASVEQALKRATPVARLRINSAGVALPAGESPPKAADVWLVRYDPRIQQIAIRRGENSGKTLPHRNTVRQLVRLGAWKGQAESFSLPASPDPAYRTAIMVQTRGGPILMAGKA